jgi:hypothetical protein
MTAMAEEPSPGALLGELKALFGRAGDIGVDLLADLQQAEARSRRFTPAELQALATVQAALTRVAQSQASANGNGDVFTALATLTGGGEQLIPQLQARLFAAGEESVGAPAPPPAAAPSTPAAPPSAAAAVVPPEHATPNAAAPAPAPAPRTFRLSDSGHDIKAFQGVLNRRFAAWGSHTRVPEDGVYGPATRKAALAVALRLGVDPKDLRHGITPALRTVIRTPSRRTAEQVARAKRRRAAAPQRTGATAAIGAAKGRYEEAIVREAQRSKLPVALVCAVIEKETTFANVYGHDKVANPVKSPPGGVLAVTAENYQRYLAHRRARQGCQGVGPMQLTSSGLQDRADALGGGWQPAINIRVGCEYLASLIKAHGTKAGIQAYNGAPGDGYATSVLALQAKWEQRLGAHAPAAGPAAPRTFHVRPKPMHGTDIKAFQHTLNARFEGWKIDVHVAEDGEYGAATRHAAIQAARGLGLTEADYQHGITPQLRSIMRKPSRRTPAQRARAKQQRPYLAKLRKQHAATGALNARAYKEARRLLDMGVMESGGNNRGPMVAKIIRANQGPGPEPWCGDFVAWCYRKAGSKSVTRSWAAVNSYLPLTGLKATRAPMHGDIVRYTFGHVGIFGSWCDSHGKPVAPGAATHIRTIEGNTGRAGAVSDSKTGGDGIYMKLRSRSLVKDFIHVKR